MSELNVKPILKQFLLSITGNDIMRTNNNDYGCIDRFLDSERFDKALKQANGATTGDGNCNIPCVTASYFESIQKGFKMLQQDCTTVSLVGFCPKEDIPSEAIREDYEKEDFDHEYQLTQSDGYDEANFWGDIYLPLTEDTYMRFDVHG